MLRVYDVSDPSQIEPLARTFGDFGRGNLTIAGDRLYLNGYRVKTEFPALSIFSIENPLDPVLLAIHDLPALPNRTFVEGDYAYVAYSELGKLGSWFGDRVRVRASAAHGDRRL